jgi:hypothetical protein
VQLRFEGLDPRGDGAQEVVDLFGVDAMPDEREPLAALLLHDALDERWVDLGSHDQPLGLDIVDRASSDRVGQKVTS